MLDSESHQFNPELRKQLATALDMVTKRIHPKVQTRVRKQMNQKTKTLEFDKEKETKNTVKFAEVQKPGEPTIIGTLYVQKWFASDAAKIKLTLEVN